MLHIVPQGRRADDAGTGSRCVDGVRGGVACQWPCRSNFPSGLAEMTPLTYTYQWSLLNCDTRVNVYAPGQNMRMYMPNLRARPCI